MGPDKTKMNQKVNAKTLRGLQRKHRHSLIVIIVILIILSTYIVLDTITTTPEDWAERSYYLKVYIIGFCFLILLFTGYIIQRELIIQRITRKLFQEEKREERLRVAGEFSRMATGQLQESLEVIHLTLEYLRSKLDKKGEQEEIKHLEHTEKELKRAENFADEILRLPELISKEDIENNVKT